MQSLLPRVSLPCAPVPYGLHCSFFLQCTFAPKVHRALGVSGYRGMKWWGGALSSFLHLWCTTLFFQCTSSPFHSPVPWYTPVHPIPLRMPSKPWVIDIIMCSLIRNANEKKDADCRLAKLAHPCTLIHLMHDALSVQRCKGDGCICRLSWITPVPYGTFGARETVFSVEAASASSF